MIADFGGVAGGNVGADYGLSQFSSQNVCQAAPATVLWDERDSVLDDKP